jgi:nucleotide-binding universal stress UspA family protein
MANRHAHEFQRILCPIDFSAHSRSALLYADELARRSGGRLFVMYANDPLLDVALSASAYDTEALEKRTIAELKRFVSRAGVTAAAEMVAVSGRPAQQIHREVRRLRADLIVMGSRGLTGVAKSLFGSTTELILRASRVPVMVVPRLKMRRPEQREWLRGWPGAVALIPIDLADYNMVDVRRALTVVAQLGASPLFLHAIPKVRFPSWLRVAPPPDYAKLTTTWTAIKKKVGAVARGSECRFVVGDPADQIAASAAAADAGVIVLSLKRGHDGTRRGSVSYRVVASDVAPVLALPEVARVTPLRKRA